MKIAILGATGYIGRSLLNECVSRDLWDVVPFSRDTEHAAEVWGRYNIATTVSARTYADFLRSRFDIVINATGVGDPRTIKENPASISAATHAIDSLLLEYLALHPDTRVFSISTGAIFGLNAGAHKTEHTSSMFRPDALGAGEIYALAKLSSEAVHRTSSQYSITDLRVYAFFSRFVDLKGAFFLSEVAASLWHGRELLTSPEDMIRDYATGRELLDTILFLYKKPPGNRAFDLRSKAPAAKFAMLYRFRDAFGLRFKVAEGSADVSPTGRKMEYCSASRALERMGFAPRETSLELVERELGELLRLKNASS